MRQILRFALQVAAGAAALYLAMHEHPFAVLLLVGAWVSLLIDTGRNALKLGKLNVGCVQEHDANCQLSYAFDVCKVIEHPSVDTLFARLLERGKAPASSLAEWRRLLTDNYVRKYGTSNDPHPVACRVTFELKNNLLFKDGRVDFSDYVHHEISIPYRYVAGEDVNAERHDSPSCEQSLTVRVVILNGALLLQVGRFERTHPMKRITEPDYNYSQRILEDGPDGLYEKFQTLTSFPLLYFGRRLGLPVRYLNITRNNLLTDEIPRMRALLSDVDDYAILCLPDDGSSNGKRFDRAQRIEVAFSSRRRDLLSAEGYLPHSVEEDGLPCSAPASRAHVYGNAFGCIDFVNRATVRNTSLEGAWLRGWGS